MQKRSSRNHKKSLDRKLLLLTLVLTFLGGIAVADVSAPTALNFFNDKYYFAKQQAVWATAGIVLMLIVSQIKYTFWQKLATPLFLINLILMLAVFVPEIGIKALGARRWISLGNFSFQPTELLKLSLCVYFASLASKNRKFISFIIPLSIIGMLTILQPDLGTTAILVVIGLSQIFASGFKFLYFLFTLMAGGAVSYLLVIFSDYRKQRLLTFLNQSSDPLGRDYHVRQALIALGSGGLFGVGLGQSRQKYLFLPESATDSIFAVIAEELGFVGALLLTFLFFLFVFQALKIVYKSPDNFSFILGMGIISWIGWQTLLNIAAMTALVPLTGIPLPFFSYGGSSLIMILVSVGILLNISRYETRKK